MSILRIEPFSGVSGDLFAGALAQLADGEGMVSELPVLLGLKDVRVVWETVDKCGVSCRKVSFHNDGGVECGHRHLSDIQELIANSKIDSSAKKRALEIFQLLGEAEANVHGIPLEKVHFHEVGAVDSIMDIVASAVLLEKLGVRKAYSDTVVTGKGFVQMAHGRYPIPAPATHQLLQGMVTEPGPETGEMSTPTGAAILRHLSPSFSVPTLCLLSSGVAGATKDFSHPNILRLSLCEEINEKASEYFLIQANIDDMTSELLGSDLIDSILEIGARDAWLNQIVMKRGRPAIKLEAICVEADVEVVSDFVLENTTTIGLRISPVSRKELPRKAIVLDTEWGMIEAKEVVLPSGGIRITPEYAACLRVARQKGRPVNEIYQSAIKGTKQ
ncbi:nickel pincer cofactor biosynthesis protein LarC [Puniceicoccaceae bacterium K14]|nr:nickel pincer cofactor biosynthesis protein LarC [Puniceicoccaceae bacterium K14]